MNLFQDMSFKHFGPTPTRSYIDDQIDDSTDSVETDGWPQALFVPLECDEDTALGFVPRVKTKPGLGSSSPTIYTNSPGSEHTPVEEDYIWFNLPTGFPSEADLHHLYPEDKIRVAAKYVRDVQIVTANHMAQMFENRSLYPCTLTEFDFSGPANRHAVLKNLKNLVTLMAGVESILKETIDVPMNGEAPVEEQPNFFEPWPLVHTGIYLSKLNCRYSLIKMVDTPRDVEIADYSLAMHDKFDPRELMFDDGHGVTLTRHQLSSLDLGSFVDPNVVNAFARVCNNTWNYYGITVRTTLDVVRKVFPRRSEEEQVDHWMRWLNSSPIPISIVKLLTIPLNVGDQFALLVVDFDRHSIQVIDTVYRMNRASWDEFASDTIRAFVQLLHRLSDPRAIDVNGYHFSVFNTPWSTASIDPESGMVAMYLMQVIGDEDYPIQSMGITEEFVRIRIRLAMCASIISSLVNKEAERVLMDVSAFILEKTGGQLTAPAALNEWMTLYNYLIRSNPVVFI